MHLFALLNFLLLLVFVSTAKAALSFDFILHAHHPSFFALHVAILAVNFTLDSLMKTRNCFVCYQFRAIDVIRRGKQPNRTA